MNNKITYLLNKQHIIVLGITACVLSLGACEQSTNADNTYNTTVNEPTAKQMKLDMRKRQLPVPLAMHHSQGEGKPVIYQVFTRLFGNTKENNKPWGTIDENGVGKFNDFNDAALQGIAELGTSYVWYTGVMHHALINDYSKFGISLDDPDVVKGRAGSPYAVKDYYNVNPDLAQDPSNRLGEFEALIKRTHKHNMKVIIDIVPNHVARQYESLNLPEGQSNFGAHDDTSMAYSKHNNFYYIPNTSFEVPEHQSKRQVLGGEDHPLADGKFKEQPAKWTGNGSRAVKPSANDWYETVKVNYGVRPDGSYDFPTLPNKYNELSHEAHYTFWQAQSDLPDSWYKFEAIAHYWLEKGVDGFRYDMAEMVPVEFWSFLNSSIKHKYPKALLLAEVYNPSLYRDYIKLGKMDYLYDKVEFYDSLKLVMQGTGDAKSLEDVQSGMQDIAPHMLHFLENHDEQRIASPEFAGNAKKGMPALVVSALISDSPTMLYFGQDVGEDGSEETGFGDPSRTSIFDYAGVPAHQRWMNKGNFDGALLSDEEQSLRRFYIDVMNISAHHPAMLGEYQSLHSLNINEPTSKYSKYQFSFVRYDKNTALIVVSNFQESSVEFNLQLPNKLIEAWGVNKAITPLLDLILESENQIVRRDNDYFIDINLAPLGSVVYEVKIGSNNE